MRLLAVYELNLDAPLFLANLATELHRGVHVQPGAPPPPDLFAGNVGPTIKLANGKFDCLLTLRTEGLASSPLHAGHQFAAVGRLTASLSSEVDRANLVDGMPSPELRNEYLNAMWEVFDRLLDYCKYERGFPLLRRHNGQNIVTVRWQTDNDLERVQDDLGRYVLGEFPGVPGHPGAVQGYGSRPIRPSELSQITDALSEQREYPIEEQFRAQVRDAIYLREYRLAAVQLAIACEVKVKRILADSGAPLKRRMNEVPITELISSSPKGVLGEGFNSVSKAEFAALVELFQCRNQVVHRGAATYKDACGEEKVADRTDLGRWWMAVDKLFQWLDHKTSLRGESSRPLPGSST